MTGRRALGGVLATGMLLGMVDLVPVVAEGATRATTDASVPAAAPAPGSSSELPFDSGPLVLLLVAGGLGTMGLLSREPAPLRRPASR
ncbi:MAG: hypothetical protein ACYDAN_15300 [Candidatus Limnocylindrales bacterium]